MEEIKQLKLDLEELSHLKSVAQRRRVISLLNILSRNPRLVSDILNSENNKFSSPQSSNQSSIVLRSSVTSNYIATKEVVGATKKLENQQESWTRKPKQERNSGAPARQQRPGYVGFHGSMRIPTYVHEYGYISTGEQLEKVSVSLAGKLINKMHRFNSMNLFFYDLDGDGSRVQVVADASYYSSEVMDRNSELEKSEFSKLHSELIPGHLVTVVGFPGKTNQGDLSIFARSIVPLSLQRQNQSKKISEA